jgi:hypothetical protein
MKYRTLATGSVLVLLICAGCLNKGSPLSDFIGGKMFSGKGAPGNQSTTSLASVMTNTGSNATTSTPISIATTTSLRMPRNLTCDRKWGQLARDQCYLEFAVGIREERICGNLTYKSLRENCFYSIAIERKDLSICNMVEDDIKRKNCFDTVQQNESKDY